MGEEIKGSRKDPGDRRRHSKLVASSPHGGVRSRRVVPHKAPEEDVSGSRQFFHLPHAQTAFPSAVSRFWLARGRTRVATPYCITCTVNIQYLIFGRVATGPPLFPRAGSRPPSSFSPLRIPPSNCWTLSALSIPSLLELEGPSPITFAKSDDD